ncbi:MAG TPA: protease complex subunit PrcB family protein [Symbiobacteriaceae bacterium]|nr:protease complex subunit PrcB family protein [Symbiobacteriaceae bacterium]
MECHLIRQQMNSFQLAGPMRSVAVDLGEVDWKTEAALVIDLGEQRTGGWSVRVESAQVSAPAQIELTLQVGRPQSGMMVIQAFTRPYALCRLPVDGLGAGPVTVIGRDPQGREILRQVVQG